MAISDPCDQLYHGNTGDEMLAHGDWLQIDHPTHKKLPFFGEERCVKKYFGYLIMRKINNFTKFW